MVNAVAARFRQFILEHAHAVRRHHEHVLGQPDTRRPRLGPLLVPVLVLAVAIAVVVADVYYHRDLTLSHYDAKAHLVVARRIVDSLRPGWRQIGAVWLPLPHLLNAIPVQSDWLYRTGLSGVALSVAGFVLGGVSLWVLVARATGSPAAAWAGFVVFAAQPDLLYLQATPMTEPLLIGLCLTSVAGVHRWLAAEGRGHPWGAGIALALACLTRYEAWPVAGAILIASAVALIRLGLGIRAAGGRVAVLALYPAASMLAFFALSRATIGAWFVTGGFFEQERATYHHPIAAARAVLSASELINGQLMTALAAAALALLLFRIGRDRARTPLLVVVALMACLALPTYAFWQGHPVRVRYMAPGAMAVAALVGIGVGLLPRRRSLAAMVVMATALLETPPLAGNSPVVVEAQRDRVLVAERRRVTECLASRYDGAPILASMGSLGHYMHETSTIGLVIRNYIHEGTGQLWIDSLVSARAHAGWVLIEEQAEGGDVLAGVRASTPGYLDGFARVCEGGGVVLYGRTDVDATRLTGTSPSGAH